MSSTQEAGEIFGAGGGPAHAMLRSPTVLIASVGLWGMNLFLFRLFRIDYVKVMKHDLLKLEELESEQQEAKEAALAGSQRTTSASNAPSSPLQQQQQQQPQKQLVQRQPSNGAPLVAAAAACAASAQNSSPLQPPEDDDEQSHDDEDQQLYDTAHLHQEGDVAISWEKLVGLSMVLLVLLHTTY